MTDAKRHARGERDDRRDPDEQRGIEQIVTHDELELGHVERCDDGVLALVPLSSSVWNRPASHHRSLK